MSRTGRVRRSCLPARARDRLTVQMHTARVQVPLMALVLVLALSCWFSATVVVPTLRSEWDLTAASATWLTASVQLGFVVGAVCSALLNLADRFPPHRLQALSAAGAAAMTAVVALAVDGLGAAIPLRFLTGVFLAGVYPVGMQLMASWTGPDRRARALGLLLAALTLGSMLPHLFGDVRGLDWRAVVGMAALVTAVGGLLALVTVRPGPHLESSASPPRPAYVIEMFRQRRPRAVNLAYFGHSWEVYALWTWFPIFVLAGGGDDAGSVGVFVFVTLGIGGVAGCLIGGWAADRWGRVPAASTAMVVSGLCCLLSPFAYGASFALLLVFGLVWGASVIADSGIFSTTLSEVVDQHYVGTALTAQTALGYLLTVVSMQLVPVLASLATWQVALVLLAPGPLLGALALRGARVRRSR